MGRNTSESGIPPTFTYTNILFPTRPQTFNTPSIYRKNILVKPQKIQIDRGGILKLNYNQSTPANTDIDVMKLYLLEGNYN